MDAESMLDTASDPGEGRGGIVQGRSMEAVAVPMCNGELAREVPEKRAQGHSLTVQLTRGWTGPHTVRGKLEQAVV